MAEGRMTNGEWKTVALGELMPGRGESEPLFCPRCPESSPAMSPIFDSGATMSTLTIGSSTIGRALASASRNALRPADMKATSLESTGWLLPS